MNKWSVQEKAPQQIVTEENFQQSAHPVARVFMFSLCCVPGLLAIFLGVPDLPKTLSCKPQGNVSQCQETQQFSNIPVNSRTFVQQQKILHPTEQNLGGTETPTLIGVSYILGLAAIVLMYSSLVVTRKTWIFDRNRRMVSNERYTSFRKTDKRYHKLDVFGVILEISDLCVETNLDKINVKINLQKSAQPTKPTRFNSLQPVIFRRHHEKLSEVINEVAKPISAILQIPYQLKFFTQDASFIFEFDRQYVDVFIAGDVFQIPFEDIQGFEIEQLADQEITISTGKKSFGINTANQDTYRLCLITNDGEHLQLHQAHSKNAGNRKSWPDNQGYQWMTTLQKQLEKSIRSPQLTTNR
jgi:hypothetical protein